MSCADEMLRANDGHVGSSTDPPGGSTVIMQNSRTRMVRTVVIVLGMVCIVSDAAVAMYEFAGTYNIYHTYAHTHIHTYEH